jgi:hypothetical protein
MSLEEISEWLKRLIEEPELGWSRDLKALAGVMNFAFVYAIKNRAYGKIRMGLAEQKRVAAQLKRVIAGEIVCDRKWRGHEIRGEAVLAEHPIPLERRTIHKAFVTLGPKGVKLSLIAPKSVTLGPKMPTFRELLRG